MPRRGPGPGEDYGTGGYFETETVLSKAEWEAALKESLARLARADQRARKEQARARHYGGYGYGER